ncbi:MAG: hypothetical protein RMX65_009175 [Nostoc sp. DedQUE01]|nr:hypothetical protein [Nostoc sp. DedQUE01]
MKPRRKQLKKRALLNQSMNCAIALIHTSIMQRQKPALERLGVGC